MTAIRRPVPEFNTANPAYRERSLEFVTPASTEGSKTFIPLYAGTTGAAQLPNPQTLGPEGRLSQPVYYEDAHKILVRGADPSDDHETGVYAAIGLAGSDIASGDITPRDDAIDFSGGVAGDVLGLGADGAGLRVGPHFWPIQNLVEADFDDNPPTDDEFHILASHGSRYLLLNSPITKNLTIVLDQADCTPGQKIIVRRGPGCTGNFNVTISGFDNDGLGTQTLKRPGEWYECLVRDQTGQSPPKKWEKGISLRFGDIYPPATKAQDSAYTHYPGSDGQMSVLGNDLTADRDVTVSQYRDDSLEVIVPNRTIVWFIRTPDSGGDFDWRILNHDATLLVAMRPGKLAALQYDATSGDYELIYATLFDEASLTIDQSQITPALGALASLSYVEGLYFALGTVQLDATAGDVTITGNEVKGVVQVVNNTVARALDITPSPTVTKRAFIVANDGTATLTVELNSVSAGTVEAGERRLFNWETPTLTASVVLSGSPASGITTVTPQSAGSIGDLATLSPASHQFYNVNTGDLELRPMKLRHATTQANPVDILIPDSFSRVVQVEVASDQTGAVRFSVSRTQAYTGLTGTYTVGETVTWTGGSARIFADTGSVLTLVNISGVDPTGTLTGGTSGATATASGALAGTSLINGVKTVEMAGTRAVALLYRLESGDYTLAGQTTSPVPGLTIGSGGALGANLDAGGYEITDLYSPWQTGTGSFASAGSGRSWNVTGNVTAVPVTNGWWGVFKNTSGSSKTIALASGSFVDLANGSTGTTLTLDDDRGCTVHCDGSGALVSGTVTLS